jgi:GNAT superfamily N-acetyltransferase
MPLRVVELRDPHEAYTRAGDFLAAEPAFNNVLLTVLGESRELGVEGRFWIATDAAAVVGFAMQSPPGRAAGLARMSDDATRALAEAIQPPMPGVIGLAPVTSIFAGHFATSHHVAVNVDGGGRLYELGTLELGPSAPGRPRLATLDDRPTLIEWSHDFAGDTDTGGGPTPDAVERIIASGRWWVWDDNGPVSMVRSSEIAAGVARVQHVYTPPEHRGNGYATASVGHLSRVLTDRGLRCVLYTQLSNPTSNAIYRALGYEPIAEVLGYTFGAGTG